MKFRRLLLIGHRWLGLAIAFVLATTAVTGAVLAWPLPSLARRIAGRLHETLSLGPIGARIVLAVTVLALALQMTGIVLWWKRRTIRVRTRSGQRLFLLDLHHSAGALGFVMMLVLATTGIGMAVLTPRTDLRAAVARLHTTNGFTVPVKIIYVLGSSAFLIQSVTGVAMWWKARP